MEPVEKRDDVSWGSRGLSGGATRGLETVLVADLITAGSYRGSSLTALPLYPGFLPPALVMSQGVGH